jgi:hypothetical protein
LVSSNYKFLFIISNALQPSEASSQKDLYDLYVKKTK